MLKEINLARTDLNLLVLFEAVLAEGHVGRAARRLNLTASAVSHGLGRLRRMFNDPLFIRTPKGVVPSARAKELAEPVADILARARRLIAGSEAFDPAISNRRFILGAPDGASAVFMPRLVEQIGRTAPGIAIGLRQLLPAPGRAAPVEVWESVFAELDTRTVDIAVLPLNEVPARFAVHHLYEEDFVVAMRKGHPLARELTLERFCAAEHLMVSMSGDPHGFVDQALSAMGRKRRVAITVPNFMLALALLEESNLIAALPRHLVNTQARRFGLISAPLPVAQTLSQSPLYAIVPKAALMDEGLAWLLGMLEKAASTKTYRRKMLGSH